MLAIEVVDGEDVGVLEAGNEPGFALELVAAGGVGELLVDDFDGDLPRHVGLVGAIDSGHAARAEFVLELVGAEGGGGHGEHYSVIGLEVISYWLLVIGYASLITNNQ